MARGCRYSSDGGGSDWIESGLGFCEFWWVGSKFPDLQNLNNPSQQREMQSAEEELNKYKLLRLPSSANKNPLHFWRDNASDYPIMSETARRLFNLSASSAQSERDFSSVGHTLTDARTLLSASKIEAVDLMRSALRAGIIID